MAHPKSLFHAEVVNDQALQGEAFVKNDGLRVVISDPLSPDSGTNPEELLGLSLSTCLNATIQALLKGRGLKNKSQVEVHIDLVPEEKGGFFFEVLALAKIEGLPFEKADRIVQAAEKRCPVAKLLEGSKTVTVKTVE